MINHGQSEGSRSKAGRAAMIEQRPVPDSDPVVDGSVARRQVDARLRQAIPRRDVGRSVGCAIAARRPAFPSAMFSLSLRGDPGLLDFVEDLPA